MKFIEPEAFIIARTEIVPSGYQGALECVGAGTWRSRATTGAEKLIEFCGRLCYKSFGVGLNKNITKVREDPTEYLGNVLKSGHGSIFEHASVSIAFLGVSRVFTHEIVRHRAGTAFSQESLRFVRLTDLKAWLPTAMEDQKEYFASIFEDLEDAQKALADEFDLDGPDMKFNKKKEITSAMRRLAPIGLATDIVVTANRGSN